MTDPLKETPTTELDRDNRVVKRRRDQGYLFDRLELACRRASTRISPTTTTSYAFEILAEEIQQLKNKL